MIALETGKIATHTGIIDISRKISIRAGRRARPNIKKIPIITTGARVKHSITSLTR